MRKRKFLTAVLICLAVAILLSAVNGMLPVAASAASSGEIQNQIDQMKEDQKELQTQIDELENRKQDNLSEVQSLVSRKAVIEQQIVLLNAQVSGINEQISAYNVLIADTQEDLDKAQAYLDDLNEQYKLRIRIMEEEGNLSVWMILFRANSFIDFLDRLNMVWEIARADRNRLQQIREATALVEKTAETLKQEKVALQSVKAELVDAQALQEKKNLEAQALLTQLVAKGEEYEKLLAESGKQQNDLLDEFAKKEQEYNDAKKYEEWLATSQPSDTVPDTDAPGGNYDENGIYWLIPTAYLRVSSPFTDERLHPILGYVRPHKGIDLSAYTGTPIYATRSGTVTAAAYGDANGNYVFINHGDGYSSAYLHMHYYIVQEGEYVRAGQMIGVVGNTGLSKGSHLHFSIIKNGVYVDPALYVDFY